MGAQITVSACLRSCVYPSVRERGISRKEMRDRGLGVERLAYDGVCGTVDDL